MNAVIFVFRPEGAKQISPGQRPGFRSHVDLSPERAKQLRGLVPPLQGWSSVGTSRSRALPWADMWLPLRGEIPDPVSSLSTRSFTVFAR